MLSLYQRLVNIPSVDNNGFDCVCKVCSNHARFNLVFAYTQFPHILPETILYLNNLTYVALYLILKLYYMQQNENIYISKLIHKCILLSAIHHLLIFLRFEYLRNLNMSIICITNYEVFCFKIARNIDIYIYKTHIYKMASQMFC